MPEKVINRIVALGVFLVIVVVYLKTLSTTVVFWDVGEFCAAARLMQVPHPPGSPLFLFIARIASLIPFRDDIAARMHAVSAVGSAFGIMFLYLVSVKVIQRFRGIPQTVFDRVVTYGASAIGAFALAFSTTYWDNSIEAEVYGMAIFFVSFVLWLALRWWEKADEPHSERYIILIAYILGLSSGVHILALLATIPILLIIYFRKYEVTRQSLVRFILVALGIFFVIYPGIIQLMPSFLDGEFKGIKSDLLPFVPFAIIAAAAYGAYKGYQTKQKMLHIACLSFLLIVLGYTTYMQVLMRADVTNLPMNENRPNNLSRFTSYITREQYGETPQLKGESWDNETQSYVEKYFPRRWSHEAMHEPTRLNYASDWDFFWRYQVNHMYIRYLLWNFIGSEGDWQDAGVSWKDTWGIPFLLALFGIYYQFKKDWKMGTVLMTMFIIMGIVLDLYQNQQDPQPRERDYFYVGAYYCMALWIAIAVFGIIDLIREKIAQPAIFRAAASGVLALCAAAVPVNLARVNWYEHDRSGEYIAWDYSYNILQSVEPDGILFTNGDNDTFPLWYLQDVEGVRRDVRIVNLSLVNTNWYISQLKNETPHGSKKVPISLSDEQIDRIEPQLWKPRQMDIPASKETVEKYVSSDRPTQPAVSLIDSSIVQQGKISFTLSGVPYQRDYRVLRIQDKMVYDIIKSNNWQRPIFFAVTCSPDSKIGLDSYLWMHGLTYKLEPRKVPSQSPDARIDYDMMAANVLPKDVKPSLTYQPGFLYRNLSKASVYYDENVQRMAVNYRVGFMSLAQYALRVNKDTAKAREIMAQMEQTVPINVLPMQEVGLVNYLMHLFSQVGDQQNFEKYAKVVEERSLAMINNNQVDAQDPLQPYYALLDIYETRRDYPTAIALLNRMAAQYPNEQAIRNRIQYYEQRMRDTVAAVPDPIKH